MHGIVLSLAALLLTPGCSTGFNRVGLEKVLREASPVYVSQSLSVEEIEALQAQVALPLRLAVAPPVAHGSGHQELWAPAEATEIETWFAPLRDAGIVRDFLILPTLLVADCSEYGTHCRLEAIRSAAARVQADALLVVNVATDTDRYANPLSVLNLTVLGMWLAPGHHRDALTIVEGVMFDNRNEYLYAFARGEGRSSLVRPFAYAEVAPALMSSRLQALEAFGDEFVRRAIQLKPAP